MPPVCVHPWGYDADSRALPCCGPRLTVTQKSDRPSQDGDISMDVGLPAAIAVVIGASRRIKCATAPEVTLPEDAQRLITIAVDALEQPFALAGDKAC